MGQSDPEKEQQTATDNGMNLVNGLYSNACRMDSIAARRTFRLGTETFGFRWGSNPQAMTLKGVISS